MKAERRSQIIMVRKVRVDYPHGLSFRYGKDVEHDPEGNVHT